MSDDPSRARERRARRAANRQDLALERARIRDRRATRYGTFQLVDGDGKAVFAEPGGYGKSLDDIEAYLGRETR